MATEERRKNRNAQQDAWAKEHTTRVVMKLNHNTDKDILEWLECQSSKQGAIKEAIRKVIGEHNVK